MPPKLLVPGAAFSLGRWSGNNEPLQQPWAQEGKASQHAAKKYRGARLIISLF